MREPDMRIGIKPGQIGLTVEELKRHWREAEEAGFENLWTFDHLTGPNSPLGVRPVQSPLPLILGGASEPVRRRAIERHLAWNLSGSDVDEFARLNAGQPEPQAQVFVNEIGSVTETTARFRQAGATRLVFVLVPPIEPGRIDRIAREAGL